MEFKSVGRKLGRSVKEWYLTYYLRKWGREGKDWDWDKMVLPASWVFFKNLLECLLMQCLLWLYRDCSDIEHV
jgi:hypothetical protein